MAVLNPNQGNQIVSDKMDTLTLPAPAKLNLFLHITGRRSDGYHELQTLFQLLDFGDTLHFKLRHDSQIRLDTDIPELDSPRNLILQAAHRLQREYAPDRGIDIRLEKRLPMGGGIGGGSSDAATTLLALNKLWNLELSTPQLCQIGLPLGADVPVFVNGQTTWAEGVGDQFIPVELDPVFYVVLHPDCFVSTAQIFSDERLTRDTPKMKIAPALKGRVFTDFRNDCETLVRKRFAAIDRAIRWLTQFGEARLTGTGACCFCRVETYVKAQQILRRAVDELSLRGFVAQGVNRSITALELNKYQD